MKTYLKVWQHLTQSVTQEPCFGNIPHDSRRQTKQYDEEIGHSQVYDEYVGHRSHCIVCIYRNTYQSISHL